MINFSKHLTPSKGNCAVSTGPIHAKPVVQGPLAVLAQAETLELCNARRLLAGHADTQSQSLKAKDLVKGRLALLGQWARLSTYISSMRFRVRTAHFLQNRSNLDKFRKIRIQIRPNQTILDQIRPNLDKIQDELRQN